MRGISDEETRDNLGGRLFAAAKALVPGSGPEFAGCVWDLPPEYGEEFLRHPDAQHWLLCHMGLY
jgi:hypothetical protein